MTLLNGYSSTVHSETYLKKKCQGREGEYVGIIYFDGKRYTYQNCPGSSLVTFKFALHWDGRRSFLTCYRSSSRGMNPPSQKAMRDFVSVINVRIWNHFTIIQQCCSSAYLCSLFLNGRRHYLCDCLPFVKFFSFLGSYSLGWGTILYPVRTAYSCLVHVTKLRCLPKYFGLKQSRNPKRQEHDSSGLNDTIIVRLANFLEKHLLLKYFWQPMLERDVAHYDEEELKLKKDGSYIYSSLIQVARALDCILVKQWKDSDP